MTPILSHGDCNVILPTISDISVDLILTDPLYGIKYRSNRQRVDRRTSVEDDKSVVVRDHYFDKIENDGQIPTRWLKDAYRVLKNDSAMYIFVHWKTWGILYESVQEVGFKVKNMIVLNKTNWGSGDLYGSFAPKHELLLFATKGRHMLKFPHGRIADVWNVPIKFSGNITVDKNGNTCSSGAGSIMAGSYHGFLRNGYLEN